MKENANGVTALLVGMFVHDLYNVPHAQHKLVQVANDHLVIVLQKSIPQELKRHMPLMMQMVLIGKLPMLTWLG